MSAWNNSVELKNEAMSDLRKGGFEQKGKFLPCVGSYIERLSGSKTNSFEIANHKYDIPYKALNLIDTIGEWVTIDDWVVESNEAIQVGADLSNFHHVFSEWLLDEKSEVLLIDDKNREEIKDIQNLHSLVIDGIFVSSNDWSLAREKLKEITRFNLDLPLRFIESIQCTIESTQFMYNDSLSSSVLDAGWNSGAKFWEKMAENIIRIIKNIER